MKKVIPVILFILVCIACHAQRTFVISVGVSVYRDSVNVTNLKKPAADAKLFAETMKMHTPNILRASNRRATKENILALLDTVCSVVKEGDRIVFFFSGHGNDGYMYTYDGKPLEYSDIRNRMNASRATEKYCFVDACRSGSVAGAYTNSESGMSNADGIVYIMSSRACESSWEGAKYDNGYFTQALNQALKGIADTDHDRILTLEELFRYVYDGVVRMSGGVQHPQFIGPADMMKITPFVMWYDL